MKPSLADFQSWYRSEYDWEIYESWAEGVSESAQVWTKYLPADRWLIRDFRRALNLGLHQVDGLKILDIACGPGHMGTVAKYLGHSYVGLDLPHEPILNGIQEFLEVQVILQAVQPLGHLPPPPTGRFDIIHSNNAAFFRSLGAGRLFNREEWIFFINDLRQNQVVHDRHLIHLGLNRMSNVTGLKPESAEFASLIRDLGGQIIPNRSVVFVSRDAVLAN